MNYEIYEIRHAMKDSIYSKTTASIREDILGETDLFVITKKVLAGIIKAAQAEAGTFWLFDATKNTITAYASIGGSDLSGIVLKPGEGLSGKCIQNNESILENQTSANKNWSANADKKTGFSTKSTIVVPVSFYDEVVGCIQLVNSTINDYFEEKDLIFISQLIDYVIKDFDCNSDYLDILIKNSTKIQDNFNQTTISRFMGILKNKDKASSAELLESNQIYTEMNAGQKKEFVKAFTRLWDIVNRR